MKDTKKHLRRVISILIILTFALTVNVTQAYAALQVSRRPVVYALDANSHMAIQGASIYVAGVFAGTTDSGGASIIAGTYKDPQQLTVRKDGYVTYQTTTGIQSGKTYTAYLATVIAFRTDFQDVTKLDPNSLTMGIENWFEFGGDGGASIWMEGLDRSTPGITCHSGNRCVGMELTDITKSRRDQFGIYNLQNLGITDQYFVSEWLYLPSDWGLHLPTGSRNWYELVDLSGTQGPTYLPYTALWIRQNDSAVKAFDLQLGGRDLSGTLYVSKQISNYPLPRGRWFNLQYYVFLHPTNGTARVWIDGTLLFDIQNIPTGNPSELPKTIPAKIYYETSDAFSPYRIWVDDLEICRSMPS